MDKWVGPFSLRDCFDRAGGAPEENLAPEVPGLYVATAEPWSGEPPYNPLCAGKSYAMNSGGLRFRIGDFVASVCGIHGKLAGRHGEGIRINEEYCRKGGNNPLDIFIAWLPMPGVSEAELDAAETELIRELQPIYNKLKK